MPRVREGRTREEGTGLEGGRGAREERRIRGANRRRNRPFHLYAARIQLTLHLLPSFFSSRGPSMPTALSPLFFLLLLLFAPNPLLLSYTGCSSGRLYVITLASIGDFDFRSELASFWISETKEKKSETDEEREYLASWHLVDGIAAESGIPLIAAVLDFRVSVTLSLLVIRDQVRPHVIAPAITSRAIIAVIAARGRALAQS